MSLDYHEYTNVKLGGGTYVNKLKKVLLGILVFLAAISMWGYLDPSKNATAANSLLGNNEVITIKTTDGQPINAQPSLLGYSSDGAILLFSSSATNLPNSNGLTSLYTYNLKSDVTSRVDVSSNGTPGNAGLFLTPQFSENGRYITFGSRATNLIDGNTMPAQYLYKRDTVSGSTVAIGLGYSGGYSHKWDRNLGVSNDGRFSLVASQRILDPTYPYPYKIILGEDVASTYTWKQVANGGGNDGDISPDSIVGGISCDAAFAAFQIQDTIKLADLRTGTVTTLSASGSASTSPIISCSGRYILYATKNRTDVEPTATGIHTNYHLIRYDRLTGERIYVDQNSSGLLSMGKDHSTMNPAQQNLFGASIANTGDVVFNYNGSVHLKHLSDGSGTLESIAKTATGTYTDVNNGGITSDGRYVLFQADPYSLGIGSSPEGTQIIRTKTNL